MKPSVLHIYKDYYPPVVGGVEKSMNIMCNGLKDEFEVSVLIARRTKSIKGRSYSTEGVEIYEAGCLGRLSSAPLCPAFPLFLKKKAYHLLHFHFPNPTGELSYLLAKPPGKVLVTYHSDIVRQKVGLWLYRSFLYRFLDAVDVIMPTSDNYIDHSEFLRRYRDKCETVPLGIDLEPFRDTEQVKKEADTIRANVGTPIVIFVGVLRYYKGIDFLLRAMKKVNAHLIVIGTGPEKERLQHLTIELGIGDRVHYKGEVSEEEKVRYIHASDVFCLPSHLPSEAYGLSQIEAMACGKPVVSTRLDTGVPFVNKHNVSGIIVPPADPSALAEVLNLLLNNEEERRRFGEQARRRAHDMFDSTHMIEHLRSIYNRLL